MNYLITHDMNDKEKQNIEKKGLYCYDLRDSDEGGEIATIEKSVLVNQIGSIITDEELKFGNKYYNSFIEFEEFSARNTEVDTIEELIYLKSKTKEELNYYAFCIGYDFLHKFFVNSGMPECDVVNEECKKLAKQFMKSKNYKNKYQSNYENLRDWVDEQEERIKSDYIIVERKTLKKGREAR